MKPNEEVKPTIEATKENLNLLGAIRIIEERGWVQGTLGDVRGVCFVGALNIADHGDGYMPNNLLMTPGYWKMCRFLNEDPIRYNDTICQSKQEMIDTIRKCAEWSPE